jgi:hypothetical protein
MKTYIKVFSIFTRPMLLISSLSLGDMKPSKHFYWARFNSSLVNLVDLELKFKFQRTKKKKLNSINGRKKILVINP